ncbi:MAG: DMT family transporter [Lachnospiraceae bacterium]|nr:DMT family transporter [Lachnospiraceae bacterium]
MQMKKSGLLFLTALIWGVAFTAQSAGMEYVGPLTFSACRFLLGGTVLLPFVAKSKKEETKQQRKTLLLGGICCGGALCTASLFQQYGMLYTTVGKAGFITALYIVIVPLLGMFAGKRVLPNVWAGVVLAAVGIYFLCMTEGLYPGRGDLLVFICAMCFSVHILVIDYFVSRADGVKLACLQFFFSGIVCTAGAFLLEQPLWSDIAACAVPILYSGVLSCGVAYTFQILGQKDMNPAIASLILSLESVVCVLAGWILLGEVLTPRQILGCVLVFSAVVLAQIPFAGNRA